MAAAQQRSGVPHVGSGPAGEAVTADAVIGALGDALLDTPAEAVTVELPPLPGLIVVAGAGVGFCRGFITPDQVTATRPTRVMSTAMARISSGSRAEGSSGSSMRSGRRRRRRQTRMRS